VGRQGEGGRNLMGEQLHLVADLAELKLVFRVLHAHLTEHLELMDSEFFTDLQKRLQAEAKRDGVDVTDHAAWGAWLDFGVTLSEGAPPTTGESLN